MRMLLELAATYPAEHIDEDIYRRLIYFRQLNDVAYQPRPELEATARYWRILQGREYFAYALNRLLEWVRANGMGNRSTVATRPFQDVTAMVERALSTHGLDLNITSLSPGERSWPVTRREGGSLALDRDALAAQR